MIRRIVLKNFMSHSHTVIDLADGLNVLIGENNSGKSAIVAALQAVCRNASGGYMVRHGKSECSVEIETVEGHKLTWRRHNAKVSYQINGEDVERLRGGIPDKLHELLRLPLVETSRDSFDVHFGEQKQPIFLLNDRSSDRAAFFASSSDTCKLIEMQELHRNRIKDAKRSHKTKTAKQQQLSKQAEIYQALDEINTEFAELESELVEIESAQNLALAIHQKLKQFEKLQSEVAFHSLLKQSFTDLQKPPKLKETAQLESVINQLLSNRHAKAHNHNLLQVLKQVEATPQFIPTKHLTTLTHQIDHLQKTINVEKYRAKVLRALQTPPSVQETRPIQQLIQQLVSAARRVSAATRQLDALGDLRTPEGNLRLSDPRLAELVDSLQVAKTKVDQLQTTLDQRNRELDEIEREIERKFREFEACPTCGQAIADGYSPPVFHLRRQSEPPATPEPRRQGLLGPKSQPDSPRSEEQKR